MLGILGIWVRIFPEFLPLWNLTFVYAWSWVGVSSALSRNGLLLGVELLVCRQSSASLLRIEVFPSILPYTEFTVYFYLSLEDNKARCPPQWLKMFALCKRIPRASCQVSSSCLPYTTFIYRWLSSLLTTQSSEGGHTQEKKACLCLLQCHFTLRSPHWLVSSYLLSWCPPMGVGHLLTWLPNTLFIS